MPTPKHPTTSPQPPAPAHQDSEARHTFNIVTDLGMGPNIRLKDNLYQGAAILGCLVVGLAVGFLVADDRLAGLIIGGIAGLLVGLFGSGIFLMVYRFIMHARGQHD